MKTARLATLIKPIDGKFTHWKAGETVLATHVIGSSYCIERPKWKGPHRLTNSCAGVPRSAFKWVTNSSLPRSGGA